MSDTEREHAKQSGAVFTAARKQQMAEGHEVLLSRGGAIFRITAKGASQFVKRVAAPRRVERGTKIRLR